MRIELTDLYLRRLKPPETGRIEISDTKRLGLRIRLYAGNSRSREMRAVWVYEKRIKGGPKRKHTLGSWPATSLSEVRAIALELEVEASRGIDRIEEKEKQRLADEAVKSGLTTIADVIETYDELHLHQLRTREERLRQLRQSLEKHLDKSITELTRKDIQQAVDAKARTGRKAYANRIRAALLAFTRWAWRRGYMSHDVGAGVDKAVKESARERVLSIPEVKEIWSASYNLGDLWGRVVRLIILTAQRRGEILNLRWSEVDFDKAQIVKPGSQTKNGKPHTTHLSDQALTELEPISKSEEREGLVFTTTGITAVSGIGKAKSRLDKMLGDNFEPWRLHDIRTAFASTMAEAGEPEGVVDRVLNHSASSTAPSTVARVYNQAEQLPQRARVLDRWAEIVTSKSGQVVKLQSALAQTPEGAS